MKDLDEEDEDILIIDPQFKSKIEKNIYRTLEAIKNKEKLIYQAGFQYKNLFIRVDYLKLNKDGNYGLIEVKAKTGVRKDKDFEKYKNKNIGELQKKFQSDISFQKYVINKTLKANNFHTRTGKTYFSYLNYKYKLDDNLNLNKLVVLDEVTNKDKTIILESEENSKEELIHDLLLSEGKIEEKIKEMEEVLYISEDDFNKKYPFSGSKFIEYFGKERPFGTI